MATHCKEKIVYPKTYALSSQVYLDLYNQCYRNIVVINLPPEGPLSRHVRRVQLKPLSQFKQPSACYRTNQCSLALTSLRQFMGGPFSSSIGSGCGGRGVCGGDLMTDDEIPYLISFLTANGYNVDTKITKMMFLSEVKPNENKLICYFTYVGKK
uniref:Uncharacterized protein n=1 Tax=viral metagenome TaxID=1070528 RepID=A0A6C0F7H1_9ZZZZ